MSSESANNLSMNNIYNVLREACGLSQAEAADFHEARLDSVKSWCSDRRTAPQGVINDLQKLAREIHASGVGYAELLKQLNKGDVYIIGLSGDEDDARICGFPSIGAQMRAVAVAISQLPNDSEIRLIERVRGAYPAPVLEPEPVTPTEADRQVLISMKFTGDKSCILRIVDRSKYERLEQIGWIIGTSTNRSDVEYRLTATGKTQLASSRSHGAG